jgi:two-component system response regulator
MTQNTAVAEILLVEDSPSDVLMTRQALESAKILSRLHVVEDGVEAMAFLRRQGDYAKVPRPHLVLLDLNLPKKSGLEVLAEIKADPALKLMPIVVLTTSSAEVDVVHAYGLHANCYITKPVDFANFAQVIRSIEKFWFAVVTLPDENG